MAPPHGPPTVLAGPTTPRKARKEGAMRYEKPTVVDYGSIAEHTFQVVNKGTSAGKDASADVTVNVQTGDIL